MSDFVPMTEQPFRTGVGLSLCLLIVVTTFYYIFLILSPLMYLIYYRARRLIQSFKFEQRKKRQIQIGALGMLIQIDHVRQVIEQLEKKKEETVKNNAFDDKNIERLQSMQSMVNFLMRKIHMNEAKIEILTKSKHLKPLSVTQ